MQELLDAIVAIIKRHIRQSSYIIVLYGSQARGQARQGSDIDVGIISSSSLSFEELGLMKNDIDQLPTLHSIDLVDFSKTSPEFQRIASQNIRTLYEQ